MNQSTIMGRCYGYSYTDMIISMQWEYDYEYMDMTVSMKWPYDYDRMNMTIPMGICNYEMV